MRKEGTRSDRRLQKAAPPKPAPTTTTSTGSQLIALAMIVSPFAKVRYEVRPQNFVSGMATDSASLCL